MKFFILRSGEMSQKKNKGIQAWTNLQVFFVTFHSYSIWIRTEKGKISADQEDKVSCILLYFLFYIFPAAQFQYLNWRPSHQVSSSPGRPAFSPLDLIRPAIELLTAASGGPGGRFDATLAACMAVSIDLVERVKEMGGDNPGIGAQQRSQLRNYWRRLRDVSAQSGYLDGGH